MGPSTNLEGVIMWAGRQARRAIAIGVACGVAGSAALAGSASAANIAFLGDNGLDDYLATQGHTTTLVSDAQVATPGFLDAFDAIVLTRDGSDFGGGLSAPAAAEVISYARRVVALNGDFADSIPGDSVVEELVANAAGWAASGSRGVIGELSGAVSLMQANAEGFTPLGLLTGSAGTIEDLNTYGAFDATPIGTSHPVMGGVTVPYNPGEVEFGTQITGADPSQVLATYTSNGNPAVLARDIAARCSASVAAHHPVGCWRFDEEGGTDLLDSSGNANDGSYLNGPLLNQPGIYPYNSAASFDGVNDLGRIPDSDSLDVGSSLTVEGWIKRSSTAKTHAMFNKGGQGLHLVVMNAGAGSQVFFRKANGTTLARSTGGIPADGQYHHVVATFDGPGTARIYIDGTEDTVTVNALQTIQDTTLPLFFSTTNTTQATYDEFALYDQVLTPADIAALHTAGTGGGQEVL